MTTVEFRRCPKCGYLAGLINCPICHGQDNNSLGGIFVERDDLRVKQMQEAELAESARTHRERTAVSKRYSERVAANEANEDSNVVTPDTAEEEPVLADPSLADYPGLGDAPNPENPEFDGDEGQSDVPEEKPKPKRKRTSKSKAKK